MQAATKRWLWRAVALTVLAGVFVSYLRPDLVVTLGNQIWACF